MHVDDLMSLVFLLAGKRSEKKMLFFKIKNIDYLKVVSIANTEFLTSALYYEMKKHKLFDTIEDEDLYDFLHEIFLLNTKRNKQILHQLEEIISILNFVNIEPLLLKGIASLVEKDYEHIGIRYLSDIDLMVHSEDIEKAYEVLMDAGYKKANVDMVIHESYHHLWPLEKDGMPVIVELHRRAMGGYSTFEYIPFSTNTSYRIDDADFSNTWVFNPTYKLYHTFFHSEVDDNNYKFKNLDLRHLYDFTVLVNKYYNKVDWAELDRLIRSLRLTNNFQSYLYMAKMFFCLTTPLTVDTKRVRNDYKKILKSFRLRDTIRSELYPLFPQLERRFSRKKMKEIYNYNNDLYYVFYVLKQVWYKLKTHLFCKGCLKYFIVRR